MPGPVKLQGLGARTGLSDPGGAMLKEKEDLVAAKKGRIPLKLGTMVWVWVQRGLEGVWRRNLSTNRSVTRFHLDRSLDSFITYHSI